ncbi:MAG: hypothetical protein Q4F81_03150 [Eubacteriales bacterium]|nr:hypothetical protein [Eubacteriales bacterium]
MKQYPFPKNRWTTAAFGLFLFALLLLARDTIITSVIVGFYKSQFLMLALIALLGLAFLICNRRDLRDILKDKRMILILAFALFFVGVMVLKRDWQIMYFSILLCLIFAVFLTFFTDIKGVSKYYVVILTALSVYALIATYVLRKLGYMGVIPHPRSVTNDAGMVFFDYGLCFAVDHRYWHRNFGIFREPGVYQFFLLLGLYLNHYQVQWKKEGTRWAFTAVLTVTMISTYSIGGFAELGLFAVFLYIDKKYYRTQAGRWVGIGCIAAAVAVVILVIIEAQKPEFVYSPLYELYDMFIRLTTASDSSVDRGSALITDLRMFLDHPLLGSKIAPVLHGTNHNTSSTLILFAILGAAGGLLHLASWVALLWKRERNVLGNLLLLLIFLMSFNTQNLVADVFFWLFPCMALVERGLPLIHKKEA